jgi:hypothetical protein
MDFQVPCKCGRKVRVTAVNCGDFVACACGERVKVPPLSELRQSAGLDAYAHGIVEKIRGQVAEGVLPAESECLFCYRPTSATARFAIVCEQPYSRGTSDSTYKLQVLVMFLLTWICPGMWILMALRILNRANEHHSIEGREVAVDVPLRCCEACGNSLALTNRKVKSVLLERQPYRELFQKYPSATVRREA